MGFRRGSEWRQWDLHLHTPSSPSDYENASITNEDIIQALIENNISAVAITDHNVIDVERIKELQKLGEPASITIFPGIELRGEYGKEPINYIGIFPEDCDVQHVKDELYAKLDLNKKRKGGRTEDELYCTLEKGTQEIHSLGGLVSIHAGKKSNSIECIPNTLPSSMAQKQDIAENVDIFELGKSADAADYNKIVFKKLNRSYPMIVASDNHNIKKYNFGGNKDAKSCWIKADTTFEGLKQIVYEPTERVQLQDLMPDPKEDYRVIDRITFDDPSFTKSEIQFNQNLNSIIGSRSSGKSTLLNHIAHSVDPIQVQQRGLEGPAKGREWSNLVVHWRDGSHSMADTDDDKGIVFIPQNYINSLAEAQSENSPILNLAEKSLFSSEKALSIAKGKLNNELVDIDRNISVGVTDLFSLINAQARQKEMIKTIGDEEGIKKEIKKLDDEIKKTQVGISEEESRRIKEILEEGVKNKKRIEEVEADIDRLDELSKNNKPNSLISSDLESEFKTKDLYQTIAKELEKAHGAYVEEYRKILNSKKVDLAKEKTKLTIRNNVLKSGDNKKLLEKGIKSKAAKEKRDARNEQEKKLLEIKKTKKYLASLIEKQKNKISEIITYITKRQNLKNDFAKMAKKILHGVEYSAEVKIDKERAEKFFDDALNLHYSTEIDKSKLPKINAEIDKTYFVNANNLNEVFVWILTGKLHVKSGLSLEAVVRGLLEDHTFIKYNLKYEQDDYEQMTPGKKALVILKLLIESDKQKFPILIDQPEDDLDSRSIAGEITDFIKKKKTERQIIIVTHNANLTVNADSEEAIVANRHDKKSPNHGNKIFDYLTGSLESTSRNEKSPTALDSMGVREHIIELLEGGEEAFNKRANKLNIWSQHGT